MIAMLYSWLSVGIAIVKIKNHVKISGSVLVFQFQSHRAVTQQKLLYYKSWTKGHRTKGHQTKCHSDKEPLDKIKVKGAMPLLERRWVLISLTYATESVGG